MLVGVIHPQLLEVYSYDGRIYRRYDAGDAQAKWSRKEIPQAFDYVLDKVGRRFDALIILSSPMSYIAKLKEVADKYANHVSVHPLIAGLLTEFINEHFTEDVAAHVEKTLAVIVDGNGYEYYKFGLVGSKELRLLSAEDRSAELKLDLNVPVPPECVLVANVELLHRSRPISVPKTTRIPIRTYDVKNVFMDAVHGAIKMAMAKCCVTSFYIIEDFCEKMTVSFGGQFCTVAPCGVPFDRKCKNERHFNGGDIKVFTSKNICFEFYEDGTVSSLKRKHFTLLDQTGLRSCFVTLLTYIDEFGVVTFRLDVPPVARMPTTPSTNVPVKRIYAAKKANSKYCEEVYGSVFLSSRLLLMNADGKVSITQHPSVNPLNGQTVNAQTVRDFYVDFFKHMPILDYKTFMLAHDGTYPAALIKVALDVADEMFGSFSGLATVSPQTIMFFHSVRKTPFVFDQTKVYHNVAMFITENMFNAIYTKYNVGKKDFELVDTWQAQFRNTTEAIQFIASGMHDGPVTTYETMTLYADDVKPYQTYCNQVGVLCKQLPFTWFEHNVLHFASHFNQAAFHYDDFCQSNGVHLLDRCPPIMVRFDDSDEAVFFDRIADRNSYEEILVIPRGTRKIEFFQKVSHLCGPKFVLFKTNTVPYNIHSVVVLLKFDTGGNYPHIIMSSVLPEAKYHAYVDLLA
uniref:DNA helicase n=1 Tax=Panagrellus redivivus TaxID=6233 RepID=A0A7E4VVY8_PANRE